MDFLEKLDYLMEKNCLNKSTLSKACNIPYTTIDGWYKKGYEGLKLTTLRKLADYFGTSLDYWSTENQGQPLSFYVSEHEKLVITKYREKPEMKPAIDALLGITTEISPPTEYALNEDDEKTLEMMRLEMIAEKKGRISLASTATKHA